MMTIPHVKFYCFSRLCHVGIARLQVVGYVLCLVVGDGYWVVGGNGGGGVWV